MTFRHLDAVVAEAEPVARRFVDAGHRIFLVGGIVRDLWLDRELAADLDLDLTTDALPGDTRAAIEPLASALWLQGERFGTVGAFIDGRAYEITTHRAESYHAQSRKPTVTFARAIDADLSRRDFTVNAMAVELPGRELFDPFDGAGDLAAGRLRTPIDPAESFSDDPLRMLRAARFLAGYGLTPVPELVEAVAALAPRLDIVSVERISDEVDKLLTVPAPSAGLRFLTDTGLLERFLPEVDLDELPDRFARIDELEPRADLRLAALLVGLESGVAAARLRSLRFSGSRASWTRAVLSAVDGVLAGPLDAPSYRRWHHHAGETRDDAIALATVAGSGIESIVVAMAARRVELAGELDDFSLPVSGDEVMSWLGVGSGPLVGKALGHLREYRFEHGPFDAPEARRIVERWRETLPKEWSG